MLKFPELGSQILIVTRQLQNIFIITIRNMGSLFKPFNSQIASFGRHETFVLRYSWLTKGFQSFIRDNDIFSSDESTVELGVGKNRVNAIKYWLRAATILEDSAEGVLQHRLVRLFFQRAAGIPQWQGGLWSSCLLPRSLRFAPYRATRALR